MHRLRHPGDHGANSQTPAAGVETLTVERTRLMELNLHEKGFNILPHDVRES